IQHYLVLLRLGQPILAVLAIKEDHLNDAVTIDELTNLAGLDSGELGEHTPAMELIQKFVGCRYVSHDGKRGIGIAVDRIHKVAVDLGPEITSPVYAEAEKNNGNQPGRHGCFCDGVPSHPPVRGDG